MHHVEGGQPLKGGGEETEEAMDVGAMAGGSTTTGSAPPPLFCDLHGEGLHTNRDYRTIAAMQDYMNRE